jgi:hypothetical protein
VNRDDEDVETLRAALAPRAYDPPEASVGALHRAVARNFSPAPRPRWRKARLAVGGALVVPLLSGSATAFAVGAVGLPDPLRVALHAVGLPVDSVAVAEAKSAESRLQGALIGGDAPQVEADAKVLEQKLSNLTASDRHQVGPQAGALLQRADQVERENGRRQQPDPSGPSGPGGDGGSSGTEPGPANPPTTGESPAGSQPSGDDGGSGARMQPGPTTTGRDGGGSDDGGSDDGGSTSTNTTVTTAPASGSGSPTPADTVPSGDSGGGGTDSGGDSGGGPVTTVSGSGTSTDGGGGSASGSGSSSGSGN